MKLTHRWHFSRSLGSINVAATKTGLHWLLLLFSHVNVTDFCCQKKNVTDFYVGLLAVYWCRIRLAWTDCSALNFIYFEFAVDIALATCISHKTRVIEFAVAVPKGLGNAKCVFYFFFPKAGKDVRCTETVDNHCLWLVWRSFTRHRLLLRCVEESEPVKCICRGIWAQEVGNWAFPHS